MALPAPKALESVHGVGGVAEPLLERCEPLLVALGVAPEVSRSPRVSRADLLLDHLKQRPPLRAWKRTVDNPHHLVRADVEAHFLEQVDGHVVLRLDPLVAARHLGEEVVEGEQERGHVRLREGAARRRLDFLRHDAVEKLAEDRHDLCCEFGRALRGGLEGVGEEEEERGEGCAPRGPDRRLDRDLVQGLHHLRGGGGVGARGGGQPLVQQPRARAREHVPQRHGLDLAAELGEAEEGHEGGQADREQLHVDAARAALEGVEVARVGGGADEGEVEALGERGDHLVGVSDQGRTREGELRGLRARRQRVNHLDHVLSLEVNFGGDVEGRRGFQKRCEAAQHLLAEVGLAHFLAGRLFLPGRLFLSGGRRPRPCGPCGGRIRCILLNQGLNQGVVRGARVSARLARQLVGQFGVFEPRVDHGGGLARHLAS
mmetsp:Transcript_39599/g.88600  ORF Transcript_39599/g.88600 Transcript_39599/m.88600 type:complete len:431 (+) Transcript_39599:203-1495(+)